MDFAPSLVHLSPEHFREPIIDRRESGYDGDRHKCVVEMSQYKIGVMQIDICSTRSKPDPRHSS